MRRMGWEGARRDVRKKIKKKKFEKIELDFGLIGSATVQARTISPSFPPYTSLLHPLHSSKNFPPLFAVTELEEPNPLPCAEREAAVGDGYADRSPDER